jgi:VIT1/CCC1 family predicted Fe2+/Mn2+ transporter
MLRPLIGLRIRDYFTNVYSKIFLVVAVSVILPAIVYNIMDATVLRFFVVSIVCLVSVALFAYSLGLTSNERRFVLAKTKDILNRFIHR